MRFRVFPVALELDGVVHKPVLIWSDDLRTDIWHVGDDGQPALLLRLPQGSTHAAARDEKLRAERLADGSRVQSALDLDDGTRWFLGYSPECCGCGNRNVLCRFSPPDVLDPVDA